MFNPFKIIHWLVSIVFMLTVSLWIYYSEPVHSILSPYVEPVVQEWQEKKKRMKATTLFPKKKRYKVMQGENIREQGESYHLHSQFAREEKKNAKSWRKVIQNFSNSILYILFHPFLGLLLGVTILYILLVHDKELLKNISK